MVWHGSYDYRLIALSVVFGTIVAYVGLDLAGRIAAARGRSRYFWLAGSATAVGAGIWCTYFLGMLALRLPVPIFYGWRAMILSALGAVSAAAILLLRVSAKRRTPWSCVGSALMMGCSLCAMHCTFMHAMLSRARVDYTWQPVVLALGFSLVVSVLMLLVAYQVREERNFTGRKLLAAMILGAAIPLMRQSAMWAVHFHPQAASLQVQGAFHSSPQEVLLVTVIALFVLFLSMIAALLDRNHMERALDSAEREGEVRFQALAEAIPQIVWIADAQGNTTYINRQWYEMTGTPQGGGIGEGWVKSVHPDDRDPLYKKWRASVASGETFEIEYRLLDATKGYCWYLDRAVPLRDGGGRILQWFGTCTDIEGQKKYQQTLEHQIKERTEELAAANERLHQEMWEKDLARRTLDEQNEKIMQELHERSQRATLLAKMGSIMQSCATKEEVLNAAMGFAPQIFPARRGAMALLNSARSLLEVIGQWNECQLALSVFEPDACWALRTGQPHLVVAGDTTAPCRHAAGVKGTYLCVPILTQGEPFGLLHFQATAEGPELNAAELSFKTTFAAQVGLSIANIRLRDALRALSIKDPLTGLYNRRYLEETLDREIRRAIRSQQTLGILMLDLDHFKKFNDTYGHDAGDAVLRETASFLVRSVRAEDVVCRQGGEEFVVMLPTADLHAAEVRAQRIVSMLRDMVVLHQGRSLGMITASVGVAAMPDHGSSSSELLQAADAALYRAKHEGRDRVVVASNSAEIKEISANAAGGIS